VGGGEMHYFTATIGAIFIFAAVMVISFVVNAFLPPVFQNVITLRLGNFSIRGNPALLVGVVVAGVAAASSFRSTLKRYRAREVVQSHADEDDRSESN
jgi:hypothetical protein